MQRSAFRFACLIFIGQIAFAQTTATSTADLRRLMTAEEFQRCGLQKLSDAELSNLNQWLTGFTVKVVNASRKQAVRDDSGDASFDNLEGAFIIADDGQFLGKITTDSIDSNSLMNTIGRYGSTISSTSIFNTISRYGSTISSLSPFNSIASTPPRVFKGETFVGYLTINTIKTPRIDPYALIGWLKSHE